MSESRSTLLEKAAPTSREGRPRWEQNDGPGRRRARLRLLCATGGAAVLAASLAVTGLLTQRRLPAPAPTGCSFTASDGGSYSLSPVQAQNAAIIAAVALRKGMPDHAVTVALAASLQETQLQNLPSGDLDSLGLFQQRPSEGWGTRAEIADPNYAASAFYDRLAQVPGWQTMPVTQAAQSVQRSATPDAYARWEKEARSLASALTGEVPAGLVCRLDGFGGSAPAPGALSQAAATELGSQLLGVAVPTKTGWRVASWVVAHAYNYHVSSVSFEGWTWTADSGSWSPPSTRGSAPSDSTVTFT